MHTRKLRFTPDFMLSLFCGGRAWRIARNRLPEDAQFAGMTIDFATNSLVMDVASSVFSPSDPEWLPDIHFQTACPAGKHVDRAFDSFLETPIKIPGS
jgi:hypothetical protein